MCYLDHIFNSVLFYLRYIAPNHDNSASWCFMFYGKDSKIIHPNNQMTPCDHFGDRGNEKLLFNRKNQKAQSCESWSLYSPPHQKHEFWPHRKRAAVSFSTVDLCFSVTLASRWVSVDQCGADNKNTCETLLSNYYGYSRHNKSSLGHSRPQTQIHRVSFNRVGEMNSSLLSLNVWAAQI